MSLQSLPALLRDEPALAAVLGRRSARPGRPRGRAPAGPRRAGAASRGGHRCSSPCRPGPPRSAWPTTCSSYLPPGRRRALPGVGDAALRAGQPERRDDGPAPARAVAARRTTTAARRPRIVVAGIRALLQRLGPGRRATSSPSSSAPGQTLDAEVLLARLVAAGYRREELVEHRGEVARRGSIIDVFPSTADAPVRIDLWGDEVDRLTEFSVHDQRSTDPSTRPSIFPARELLPTDEVRAPGRAPGRGRAVGPRAVGAPGRGPDLRRHGELAALAGRRRATCSPTACRPTAQVMLVEPRRLRDRAADMLAEEADLAAHPGPDVGRRRASTAFPRLHLPFDGC